MPVTAVWQKWLWSASYDSFVGKQTVVLRSTFVVKIATFAKLQNDRANKFIKNIFLLLTYLLTLQYEAKDSVF
jgi:hypothetical protein